jgi:hypothetical protein
VLTASFSCHGLFAHAAAAAAAAAAGCRGEYGRLGIADRTGSSKLRPHKVRGLEGHTAVQVRRPTLASSAVPLQPRAVQHLCGWLSVVARQHSCSWLVVLA